MSDEPTATSKARGARLRAARKNANLTQKEVAEGIGIASHGTISQYESGDRTPAVETLQKLADLYGVPAGEFVDDLGPEGDRRLVPVNSRVKSGGLVAGIGARTAAVVGSPQFRKARDPAWSLEDVPGAGPNWYVATFDLDPVRLAYGEGDQVVDVDIKPGDMLVMADDAAPRHGDIVHAHTARGEKSELRLYVEEDGKGFLVPLFPGQRIAPLKDPWKIGAVLHELRRKRR